MTNNTQEKEIVLLPEGTLCAQMSSGLLLNSYDLCEASQWYDVLSAVVCLWKVKPPHKVLIMMNTPTIYLPNN